MNRLGPSFVGEMPKLLCDFQVFLPHMVDQSDSNFSKATVIVASVVV
jgi:hypothetical protein